MDVLTQVFARLGHEAIAADNAYSGLNLFVKGQYDIVFTDYDMPGMDGITFAHHIKEICPDSLIILMTGHDRASILKQIENSRIDLALFKPFGFLELRYSSGAAEPTRERRQQAV